VQLPKLKKKFKGHAVWQTNLRARMDAAYRADWNAMVLTIAATTATNLPIVMKLTVRIIYYII